MFFKHHINNEDIILIVIQDQNSTGLLVTYINGLKSKFIIDKKEANRLINILENN